MRSIGEPVKGNGQTSGIIPFVRVMDSLTLAISQGSLRRGSAAVYLDVHHPEIEEFVEIRKPSGDFNRKSLNLHHGIAITDEFMEAVRDDRPFALRSPLTRAPLKTVSARLLWQKILETRLQTGEPYLLFIDTANRALPKHQRELGLSVRQSNLCSEILLPTGRDHRGEPRTAVCCLSSVNFETWDEWSEKPRFIEDLLRFLDNVLEEFIATAPESMAHAKYSAERERSVGLGAMGFHSFLQAHGIPFESALAKSWNMKMFKHLARRGRRGVARARARARRVPRRGRARRRGALQPQARDRADGEHQHHLRRHERVHRADPGEHLHAQDAVGLVHGEECRAGRAAAGEGLRQRRNLALDPRARRLRAAPDVFSTRTRRPCSRPRSRSISAG